ncbi:hypothetical protein [Streptomyces avicenniae]|uniref:hypothetical protein n=1 Tax=Streptomyces avicenniae TaxID=500153 RepID=UPI00069946CE|nr:hypothetical protein [Streptomyces avicenniae]
MALTPGDPGHRAVRLIPLADDYGQTLSDPLAGARDGRDGRGRGETAGRSGMPSATVAAAVEAATERHGAALMAELGSRLPPCAPDATEHGGDSDTDAADAESDASDPRTRGQPAPTRRLPLPLAAPLPHISPFRITTPSAVRAA